MLTIVILTKNEQANLPGCLAAIPERYPIVIVDSGSTEIRSLSPIAGVAGFIRIRGPALPSNATLRSGNAI